MFTQPVCMGIKQLTGRQFKKNIFFEIDDRFLDKYV